MDTEGLNTVIRKCYRMLYDRCNAAKEVVPVSAYLTKSLVRGDFVPGKSDIDLFLVFHDEVNYKLQADFANKLSNEIETDLRSQGHVNMLGRYAACDIFYLCEKDIPRTQEEARCSPHSIFTVFGFDLEQHHTLIDGKDVLETFTAPDPSSFADVHIKRILERWTENGIDPVLASGQILRTLLIKTGLRSLHKKYIREYVKTEDIEDPLRSFTLLHVHHCYEASTDDHEFMNACENFLRNIKDANLSFSF